MQWDARIEQMKPDVMNAVMRVGQNHDARPSFSDEPRKALVAVGRASMRNDRALARGSHNPAKGLGPVTRLVGHLHRRVQAVSLKTEIGRESPTSGSSTAG